MVELRGIEVTRNGSDKVVSAIVRTKYHDIYEHHELFRNEPVNRGQVLLHLGRIFDMEPGHVVWPDHIKAKDF